jgi:signal transduction histidine kinase
MQLHLAADQVSADSPAKPTLNRVLQLMGQVIEEGRNAVRGLRSTQNHTLDLEDAFCQVQQELSIGASAAFRVIAEGPRRPLHPVLRDDIFRIGREALVNAFRHSKAKRIEAEIDYGARHFRLLVRDNGCGIDKTVLKSGRDGHWGLPGMRERAESMGAQLNVWSSAAAGTEVVLTVPAHIAYQPGTAQPGWKWLRGFNSRNNRESR